MSEASTGKTSAEPEQLVVTSADGVRVTGWAVRQDVVVVPAGGLAQPIRVGVDGAQVEAEGVHESTAADGEQPWTALELPFGTINVTGELFPPILPEDAVLAAGGNGHEAGPGAPDPVGNTSLGARRAFWCIMFPAMRGCR